MIKPHHIDEAYQWLCKQRRNYPDNAYVWHLRFHWATERTRILQSLNKGDYSFAPLQVITNPVLRRRKPSAPIARSC